MAERARTRIRRWLVSLGRRLIEASLVTVVLLLATAIWWTKFGVRDYKLVMLSGEHGFYGVIEDPEVFIPGTKIISFDAVFVPSRIGRVLMRVLSPVGLLFPVAEVVEVSISYQLPHEKEVRTWERTYWLACSENALECVTMYNLIGVMIRGPQLVFVDTGKDWVYLRGQLIPRNSGGSPKAQPTPSPSPQRYRRPQPTPPAGILEVRVHVPPVHKAGRIFFIP